jgi:hypothetical protein
MRVLSLHQPWAQLVANGSKQWETRSWSGPYRGPVAIHASASIPKDARALFWDEPLFREHLCTAYKRKHGDVVPDKLLDSLTKGSILAVGTLVQIARVEEIRADLSEPELAFGDYSDLRFAWQLADVVMLDQPIPAKGSLGLWEPPSEIKSKLQKIWEVNRAASAA